MKTTRSSVWKVEIPALFLTLLFCAYFGPGAASAAPLCSGGTLVTYNGTNVGCKFDSWGPAQESMCNGAVVFEPSETGTCWICVVEDYVDMINDPSQWDPFNIDPSCLGSVSAGCTPDLNSGCKIDLKTGIAEGVCNDPAIQILNLDPPDPPDEFFSALVQIDVDPGADPLCSCAEIIVEYEGEPQGWTLNVANSATNNGYGGNSPSDPSYSAELQIDGKHMIVYGHYDNPPVDRIWRQETNLADGAIKFVVCDQFMSWSPVSGNLDTAVAQVLFHVPDNTPSAYNEEGDLFVAVNRVVRPTAGRVGQNARSVTIRLR